MKPIINYFQASRSELAKVSWPNRNQTIRLTGLVIVFSLAFAVVLGGIDFVFATILQKVILKG
jgi:preprotein translocase subunit SecE